MRQRDRLRRRGIGVAASAVLVSTALVAQSAVSTDAAWNDAEWASAPVSTLDCADPSGLPLLTRGEGRVLSGSALNIDLDALAGVPGVVVENDAGAVSVSPTGTAPVEGQSDAYADDLNVELLSGALGVSLSNAIKLPYDTDTGVYGQYAQATRAEAAGAAGTVTDSGAINMDAVQAGYPDVARLDLLHLVGEVNQPVASLLSNISGARLEVGAVGARSHLEGCDYLWSGDLAPSLHRDYLAAGADLVITSPAVGQLVSGVDETVEGVQTAVDGLTFQVLKPLLENTITGLVNGLLSNGLNVGSVTVTRAVVSIDLSAVRNLLTGTISDPDGILAVDLQSGEIRVKTAALLAKAYANDPSFPSVPSSQLNGLAPNTDLLGDPRVLAALNTALGSALDGWVASVNTALDQAVGALTVDIEARVSLRLLVEVARVSIGVHGGLDSLTATAPVSIIGIQLPLITQLLNGLTAPIVAGVIPLVRNLVLGTDGIVRTLPSTVTDIVGTILSAVSTLNIELFLNGVVQVLVNAQNRPLVGANPVPHDLAAIEASHPNRFDVAAIRLSVLGSLGGEEVRVYLARGSADVDE